VLEKIQKRSDEREQPEELARSGLLGTNDVFSLAYRLPAFYHQTIGTTRNYLRDLNSQKHSLPLTFTLPQATRPCRLSLARLLSVKDP